MRPKLGILILATALAGCGKTGVKTVTVQTTSGHTAAPVPTRAQFITRADAICRGLFAEQAPIKAHVASLEGRPSAEASKVLVPLARLVRRDVAIARAANAKIQALPEPPTDTAMIQRLLTAWAEEATDLSNIADAVVANELAALGAARGALKKADAFGRGLAQGFGLRDCGAEH